MSVKQCPEQADYRFKTACTIQTCKFFTEHTKNKCMALDTKFAASEKGITDSELCVLKFPEHDKKTVFTIRKNAQDRVRAIIVLYQFARHCYDNEDPSDGFDYIEGENEAVDAIVNHRVFNLKLLELQPWMLKFLFDDDYMRQVCQTDVKLYTLFKLKPKEFDEIKMYVMGKTK